MKQDMKDVLITGAGSGIGQAAARLFSKNNYRVFLVGRTPEKLLKTQGELTSPSVIIASDVGTPTGRQLLLDTLQKHSARISVLVNNAGIYQQNLFANSTEQEWLSQFQTNLFGAVFLTQLLWDDLKSTKGAIVNVSSTLGLRPIPTTSAYSASKAAMNSWTQTLALEGGEFGIRANAICPGLVDTPIHQYHKSSDPHMLALRARLNKLQPMGRVGEPEDIAEAIYFAATEKSSWLTGALLPVDGGVILTTRDP